MTVDIEKLKDRVRRNWITREDLGECVAELEQLRARVTELEESSSNYRVKWVGAMLEAAEAKQDSDYYADMLSWAIAGLNYAFQRFRSRRCQEVLVMFHRGAQGTIGGPEELL